MDIDTLKRIKPYEEYKFGDVYYFHILIDIVMNDIFNLPVFSGYIEDNMIEDFKDLLSNISIFNLVKDSLHDIFLIKIEEKPVMIINQYKGCSIFNYTILDNVIITVVNNIMSKFIIIDNKISNEVDWIEDLVEHNDLELIYEKGESL